MECLQPAPSIDELVACAADAFRRRFGAPPTHGAFAPGRVNLIGEHTDYNRGFVLPIAIDRYCVAVGSIAKDPARSRLVALDPEGQVEVDLREPAPPGRAYTDTAGKPTPWAGYVIGVIEEFFASAAAAGVQAGAARRNFDIVVCTSVPLGAGLSSSASLEVSVCSLLQELTGASLPPLERARLCQRAEHKFANVPCGIMDMYVAVHAERGRALLIDCRDDAHESVPMPPGDDHGAVVVIINTNVKHELSSSEYAVRRHACEGAARILGCGSLREVNAYREPDAFGLLSDDQRDFTRHVVEENTRVNMVASILREAAGGEATWKRALPAIGEQMSLSHESLRDLYRVSCDELDSVVEIAGSTSGVYGARMTGGGFGGCAVALVRPFAVTTLVARLQAEYPGRHGRDCTVYVTGAECGARPARLP